MESEECPSHCNKPEKCFTVAHPPPFRDDSGLRSFLLSFSQTPRKPESPEYVSPPPPFRIAEQKHTQGLLRQRVGGLIPEYQSLRQRDKIVEDLHELTHTKGKSQINLPHRYQRMSDQASRNSPAPPSNIQYGYDNESMQRNLVGFPNPRDNQSLSSSTLAISEKNFVGEQCSGPPLQ